MPALAQAQAAQAGKGFGGLVGAEGVDVGEGALVAGVGRDLGDERELVRAHRLLGLRPPGFEGRGALAASPEGVGVGPAGQAFDGEGSVAGGPRRFPRTP